ncbi:pentatricopeptide repeat-containing protein At1g61870, mitochondrial [Prunus persica]|uniref:pentatricopeptide repeat-containing protein At1g61870, mitochondrial n=1 Tax=Prunus persica TaxID=3760 RepID=UPI0002C2AFD9|nr:pentatricopeptide repeat-containing protein At1g61870, mitochondrial [Prunus persica]
MSLLSRLRHATLAHHTRHLSTAASVSTKDKTRAALSLLKAEKDPTKILEICKTACLTPESHLDRITFSVAINKLRDDNHYDLIRQFLDDLFVSRPDLKTQRFASHAIVLYGQADMLHDAVRTFEQCDEMGIPRNVKTLNALLLACIFAKNYKEVNRVFLEFPKVYGIEPNLDTYNYVIKAFSESGSTSSAYSVLAEMERKNVKPNANTFGHLLTGFYTEMKFEDVGKVTNLMEKHGFQPGLSTYNIRIKSLCKLRKSAEAKALLDGMLSRGMKANAVTYCHLIHGFCRESNLGEAKKLFKNMVNRGFTPDSDCYYTLVHFLCKGGEFESALQYAKESIEKNWVPNFATIKSLVEGLVSISKVSEARELVGQMKERFTVNQDKWNEIEAGLPQ